MKKHLTLLLLVISLLVSAQNQKAEKIVKALEDYFFLERENIYVQMDKSTFFTNETIWLKGYVYHRKKAQPFFNSTNIYAVLIDDTGKAIDTKLLYGNLGSFVGHFKLDKTLKSGKYYIQFYTNWMNNFTEDESFTKEITIINENDNPGIALRKKHYSEININIMPEGGTYLKGVSNVFGVNVSDCDGRPVAISTADVLGKDGKAITKMQLNKLGNGRLELPANSMPGKITVTLNGKLFEMPFPQPKETGFAVSVNNYSIQGKTIINITTNALTASAYTGQPTYLLIHQDDKSTVYLLNFDSGNIRQTLSVPSNDLPEGLNTIRLLDQDYKELNVRMSYNYPETTVSSALTVVKPTEKHLKFQDRQLILT